MLKLGVALVVLVAVSAGPPAKDRPRQKWLSDVDHSSIEFRTQHWGIVDIIGWLEDFQITVYADEDDFSDAIIEARVGVGSIRGSLGLCRWR